jgi:hypothetical protein
MVMVSGKAILSIRGDFAILHLQAALRAANNAREVEGTPGDGAFGTWQDEMLVWVPVAVVMAAAALEANANEVIQDIADGKTTLPLTESKKEKLGRLMAGRAGNALSRYCKIAILFNRTPSEDESYWQNAARLVKFRNAFMHFRPVFYPNSTANDRDLIEELTNNVPTSSAYRSPEIQFPYSFMSYGCAKWSVQTVLAFSAEFSKLLDMKDKFVPPGFDFSLP